MKDFDSLKDLWKQEAPAITSTPDLTAISKQTLDSKRKMMNQSLRGGIILLLTGVFITWIGFFSNIHFKQTITYVAMIMMIVVVVLQGLLTLYTRKKLQAIDDTQPPEKHLQQWQEYYQFRQKQIQWNKPLYFIVLNIAMGLYFIEVMGGRPAFNVTLFIIIYIAWMLFAYFVLGKKMLAKEEKRLKGIIDGLKEISKQF